VSYEERLWEIIGPPEPAPGPACECGNPLPVEDGGREARMPSGEGSVILGTAIECRACGRRWVIRGGFIHGPRWVEQRRTLFRKRWVDAS
jgi:hypothetical protein